MRPRLLTLFASGTLLMSSCSGTGSSPDVASGTAASSSPLSSAASEQSTPPNGGASTEACPYNDSPCRGPLAAGTYRTDPTDGFWFPLEYTVPAGWENIEDYPNAFDLRYTEYATDGGWNGGGATAGISVFLDVGTAPPDDPCNEVASERLTVDEWVEGLTSDPDVVTSDPQPVTTGGLDGVSMDVSIAPDYEGTCFFGRDVRTKGLLVQPEKMGVHRGFPEAPQRVIFLGTPSGSTITILVEDRRPEDAYRAFLEDNALPVIESFVFDPYH